MIDSKRRTLQKPNCVKEGKLENRVNILINGSTMLHTIYFDERPNDAPCHEVMLLCLNEAKESSATSGRCRIGATLKKNRCWKKRSCRAIFQAASDALKHDRATPGYDAKELLVDGNDCLFVDVVDDYCRAYIQ
jgi:hypothetical protein